MGIGLAAPSDTRAAVASHTRGHAGMCLASHTRGHAGMCLPPLRIIGENHHAEK